MINLCIFSEDSIKFLYIICIVSQGTLCNMMPALER